MEEYYKCPFCEEVSSGSDWNDYTSRAVGDDITPIEDNDSMCWHVCPYCDIEIDRVDIEEVGL